MENLNVSKENLEGLKGKVKMVGDIAINAAMKQIGDDKTMTVSLGVGLVHGLVRGSVKRGIKAGLVTLGIFAGANAVSNIANNWDKIKNQ